MVLCISTGARQVFAALSFSLPLSLPLSLLLSFSPFLCPPFPPSPSFPPSSFWRSFFSQYRATSVPNIFVFAFLILPSMVLQETSGTAYILYNEQEEVQAAIRALTGEP